MEQLKRLSLNIFLGLLAYVPLHIFLSTWVGSTFHVLSLAKVAKDIALLIGFLFAVIVSLRENWFNHLLKDKLVWLILAYSGLNLLLAIVRPADQGAEVLGLVYNTRFLMFFLYGLLLVNLYDWRYLKRRAVMIVVLAAAVVLLFGVAQYVFLPNDALRHFGYSRANGVLPAFFIDDKPDLERIMSTLRDPNSFGSYIIIIGMIALSFVRKTKDQNVRQIAGGLLALNVICLWFTFSRSALLGFGLGSICVVVLGYGRLRISPSTKKRLIVGCLVASIALIGATYSLRHSYFVQNVIFHADQTTKLEDPNQLRLRFWRESITSISNNPLGYGPGTAGLASIHNHIQGTRLNENYYLQIAYETGLAGLALFLTILITVAKRLFRLVKNSTIGTALLASFIGLALTNFLVHIWSNEAVAYTWWGLAAIVLGAASRSNHHKIIKPKMI